MSKKKSLGSSPIGFQSESGSMSFIPDLGVAQTKTEVAKPNEPQNGTNGHNKQNQEPEEAEKSVSKKIVSYNLEEPLIEKVKQMADERDIYYSTLVTLALRRWITENS